MTLPYVFGELSLPPLFPLCLDKRGWLYNLNFKRACGTTVCDLTDSY